jgi:hypothetical protein
MLSLFAILTLLLVPLLMLAIRLARPRFAYFWLVAAVGALLAWPLVLLARLEMPAWIPLADWRPQELFPVSPALIVDSLSWPYALVLATLVLAVILTDVARAPEADWIAWSACLVITAFGLLAVLAGNPLTLLLAWAAIDLFELVILLLQIVSSKERGRVVTVFFSRVTGIVLLVWAAVVSGSSGVALVFATITPEVSVYLLLAAGLRLGVLPLHPPFLRELPLRRGLGTLLRLVPVAASLILLARTSSVGVPAHLALYFLILAGVAAFFGAASWAMARDELEGRQFWILGMAAISLTAAIRSQPEASVAWGVALLLSGGLLFLNSAHHRYLLLLSILGFLGISTLPITPAWEGVRVYTPLPGLFRTVILIAHALLMAGYARHALRPAAQLGGVERWVWVIYPLGLALMPFAHVVIALWGRPNVTEPAQAQLSLIASWPAVSALVLAGGMLIFGSRFPDLPAKAMKVLQQAFSFNWLYNLLWSLYHLFRQWITFINQILEGEGGILWTLLLLTLLLSLLAQRGVGG